MRASQGQLIFLKNYREPEYRVLSVDLDISLHPTETRVCARIVLERHKDTQAGHAVVLDGDELKLVSLAVEGKMLSKTDYRENSTSLRILKVPKKRRFKIEIVTEINPTANTKLMGLFRSGGNYCTQCEAEGFRRITYFMDRPDVLAVYTTRIEADRKDAPILLGNGNRVKKGRAANGRHFAIWHDPHPKPSYLFALVAGDLGAIHKNFKTVSGRKVRLGIHVHKGKEKSAEYAMDALVRSMLWDEKVFGCEYDLDVFNIVAIPDFNMGAMENKGLNVFNDKYVLADPRSATDGDYANIEAIIAHEYFHNWTGNRITCRDWFQLCLKEGLTVYRDQEFSSDQRSRPVCRIGDVRRLKTHQFPEDAGPLAHPVRPASYREINNFYTTTVYEKGAELVRMLATILGEKHFRKGMELYFKRHDGKAATIEHFLACFSDVSPIDLGQFYLWYSQAGTPSLSISTRYDKSKQRLSVEIEQFVSPTPGQHRKAPMHIPQRIALIGAKGNELKATNISGADNKDGVFHITKRKHKLQFDGIGERPVLSINRGFTAPVEINYRHSSSELAFLARHESDAYNRWQALQNYAARILISAIRAKHAGKLVDIDRKFLDVVHHIANDCNLEPAFRASMLILPGEGDLTQMIGRNVDPDAIHKARTKLMGAMGTVLEHDRSTLAASLATKGAFNPGAEDAGKRSLKNVLLSLAVIGGSSAAKRDVSAQFNKANNMSERYAALQTIIHYHPSPSEREHASEAFYKRHKHDHLIMDKWFMVQATKPGVGTIKTVRALIRHKDFSITNPNRLRSLIGAFAGANPTAFNAASGSGYKLVTGIIAKVDRINPQVAARLLTAFRSFDYLEPVRRKLAKKALSDLAKLPDLSRDVEDILQRTLG